MLNDYKVHGRLTAKPELKTTKNDKKNVHFTLAVDRNGKDAVTDFISFVAWDKLAEHIAKHFDKGQQMLVEATIQSRSVTEKNSDKTITVQDIVVKKVHFCGYKAGTSNEGSYSDENEAAEE